MEIPPLLIQFGGSLAAILALFWLARVLRLGGDVTLRDETDVRDAIGEVDDRFSADRIAISSDGAAALAADSAGRVMLLKRHGNRFAGRILAESANARVDGDDLIVVSGETRYGSVRLVIENPRTWADAINRL